MGDKSVGSGEEGIRAGLRHKWPNLSVPDCSNNRNCPFLEGSVEVPDKPWKQLEREAAQLINGRRHPASSGGPVDAESDTLVCQVKHRRTMSLQQIEAEALAIEKEAQRRGKVGGILVLKRRAGRGTPTPLLVCMTEAVWKKLIVRKEKPVEPAVRCDTQE